MNTSTTLSRNRILAACLVAWATGMGAFAADELPAWWPAEVPVVAGAEITETDHAEQTGLPSVCLKVPLEQYSMESLIELYRDELAALGWSIGRQRDTGLTRSVTATKASLDKGDRHRQEAGQPLQSGSRSDRARGDRLPVDS